MNISKIADKILKQATDISQLDSKFQNRIGELKKIHKQIADYEQQIAKKVGDLQKQIKVLEKQSLIFEKEILPELQRLEDHAVEADGIFIELKSGRRSPKVGYEYLVDKVRSELITAAEQAMTEAAKFAQSPTITITSHIKTSSKMLDWLVDGFKSAISWLKSLRKKNEKLEILLETLNETLPATEETAMMEGTLENEKKQDEPQDLSNEQWRHYGF